MKKTLIAAALATAFTLPAFAHEDFTFELDMGPMLLAQAEMARDFSAEMSNSMAFMFTDRAGRGRVVKGQPYSADVVTETNQTLPDGNVISHRNVNKVWRDGEGRTRQESYREEKLRSVYISDPVGKVAYTVIPGSKIAIAIPRIDMHDGRRVTVRTVESDGQPGVREEVRVQVVRVGDDASINIAPPAPPPVPPVPPTAHVHPVPPIPPVPPIAMIPGVNTMRFESTANLGKGDPKSLGTRDFEGVKAEGKQTTWTIPAGKIGNKNPITVTSESWYSPDLQVTVYSRHNDPRTGESLYRLASIKRAEPSADLFKVPEGYEVKGRTAPRAKEKSQDK